MQSLSDPLNRLYDDGSWFARAHEIRLWAIRCDENLRKPVLALLPKFQCHHDNDRAWPVLFDAHTSRDDGWQLRANNLAADWGRRVEAFAADGVVMTPVEARMGPTGFAAFRDTAAAILAAVNKPLSGLVIVLAPTIVDDPGKLEAELFELLGDPDLRGCRWVLCLDVDLPWPGAMLHALGQERALATECRVNDAQRAKDFAAALGSTDPTKFGTAWPVGVVPPPRVDDPPPLPREQRDAALRAHGINPAFLDAAPQIRAKTLGAALAMKEGRGADAIALQREATALCADLELFELLVITKTALASYLSGLGHRALAKQEVGEAIELSRQHALGRSESLAWLTLGLLHNLDGEHQQAVGAYTEAARSAEHAAEPILAIEGWRMAGQLAMGLRADQAAVDCFLLALRVAEDSDPELAKHSSAPEAARALANLYERRNMPAQAASLHAHADALELDHTNAEANRDAC